MGCGGKSVSKMLANIGAIILRLVVAGLLPVAGDLRARGLRVCPVIDGCGIMLAWVV